MAVRFDDTFYTFGVDAAGTSRDIRVRIYDEDFSGTALGLDIRDIVVEWPDANDDIFIPLMASQCRIIIHVDNSDTEALVNDFKGSAEERFVLRLDRGGSLYWIGYVLPDLVRTADRPLEATYDYTFTATDGIARLKNIPFLDGAGDPYTGVTSALNLLFQCLSKIGLSAYWGGSDPYLRIHATWFATGVTATFTSNPFVSTYVQHRVFRKVDRDGNAIVRSTYEVLHEMVRAMGCRFFFSDGEYWCMEVADYARSGATISIQNYTTSGGATTPTLAINWAGFKQATGTAAAWNSGAAQLIVAAGGSETFFPPFSAVKVRYKHYTTQNLISGESWSDLRPDAVTIYEVDNGGGVVRIALNFILSTRILFVPADFEYAWIEFHVKIIIDGNYLKRTATWNNGIVTYGDAEWTTVSSDRFVSFSEVHANNDGLVSTSFSLITPPMPASGDLEIQVSVEDVYGLSGVISPASILELEWVAANPYFETFVDGNVENQYNYTVYESVNDEATNSSIHELDVLLGDGPLGHTFGALQWSSNLGVTRTPTTTWRKLSDATTLPLGQLIARERMAMQQTPTVKLQGRVYGDYDVHKMLERDYDNGLYLFMGGRYSVASETWEGTWVRIAYAPGGVINNPEQVAVGYPGFANDDDSPFTGGVPGNPSQVYATAGSDRFGGGVRSQSGATAIQPAINTAVMDNMVLITTAAIAAGASVSNILFTASTFQESPPTNAIQFFKNDNIILIHPVTGAYQRFVLSKDSLYTTNAEVNTATALHDFPVGTHVRLASLWELVMTQNVWRMRIEQVTLFTRTQAVAVGGVREEFVVVGLHRKWTNIQITFFAFGTGTFTIVFYRNGAAVRTITTATTANASTTPVSTGGYLDCNTHDKITFEITAVTGTAPTGLSIILSFA